MGYCMCTEDRLLAYGPQSGDQLVMTSSRLTQDLVSPLICPDTGVVLYEAQIADCFYVSHKHGEGVVLLHVLFTC